MEKSFFTSSVGKKIFMALTGLILIGFILGHMAGNLQIFAGKEKINHYAALLKSMGPLLWGARIFLLTALLIHIKLAIQLKIENSQARPIKYIKQDTITASIPSRTMIYSGITLASFLLYHLLHFTFGLAHPELMIQQENGHIDVYAMVVESFRNPIISTIYIFSMFLLSMHLWHGISSAFQSLGIKDANNESYFSMGAIAISLLVFLGNTSIPVAILLNYIH